MKFGVREICDVVFKAKSDMKIGTSTFVAGQPVLYIDTATTSSLEQATTTVYAQGGRGNTRLVTWEGEKTMTFSVTDALLSPIGLSILSGAGLFKDESKEVHVHMTAAAYVSSSSAVGTQEVIDLTDALGADEKIDPTAPVFVSITEADGSLTGTLISGLAVSDDGKKLTKASVAEVGKTVFVDFYVVKASAKVSEIQIDAASFGGNFYVEASTLFRDQATGKDLPCEITLPNVKIQSNFTFSMASTGDPSTFEFVMDAMPGYTMFDRAHKVMCVMQVVEDTAAGSSTNDSVMKHTAGFDIPESAADSTTASGEAQG